MMHRNEPTSARIGRDQALPSACVDSDGPPIANDN
jgi:hypothetical protein